MVSQASFSWYATISKLIYVAISSVSNRVVELLLEYLNKTPINCAKTAYKLNTTKRRYALNGCGKWVSS